MFPISQTDLLAIYRKRNCKMLCCSFLHQPLFENGCCGNLWATHHKQTLKTIGWLGGRALYFRDIPSQAVQAASKSCRETSKPKLGKGTAWNLLRPTSGQISSVLVSQKSSWTPTKPNYVPYPRSACEHAAVHTLHLEGPLPWPMLLVHAGKHTHTSTCISHCFQASFKPKNLSCRAGIIMTGRNGFKCCLKSAKSLLCKQGSGLSFLSLFTSLLWESAGKLICKWTSRCAFTFNAISDPQGEILQKLWVHSSPKAELQHTFRKAINFHFYLQASGSNM